MGRVCRIAGPLASIAAVVVHADTVVSESCSRQCISVDSPCGSVRGQQGEHVGVAGSDDGEMASIRGGYVGQVSAFGRGYDRGVGCSQRQVSVFGDEFGDAEPVRRMDGLDRDGQVPEEPHFGFGPESGGDEVGGLGDDQGRYDEGGRGGFGAGADAVLPGNRRKCAVHHAPGWL